MKNNMHKFLFPIKLVLFVVFAQLTILLMIIKSIQLWRLPIRIIIENTHKLAFRKLELQKLLNDIIRIWKKN
jgi:hypothetical protein